jgi:hypothetical protein
MNGNLFTADIRWATAVFVKGRLDLVILIWSSLADMALTETNTQLPGNRPAGDIAFFKDQCKTTSCC